MSAPFINSEKHQTFSSITNTQAKKQIFSKKKNYFCAETAVREGQVEGDENETKIKIKTKQIPRKTS